jgi:DNA-binding NarL/FixJ family response regulator
VDSYEVARRLKKTPRPLAHILVMTAKVREQDRLEAIAAGADDYIQAVRRLRPQNRVAFSVEIDCRHRFSPQTTLRSSHPFGRPPPKLSEEKVRQQLNTGPV